MPMTFEPRVYYILAEIFVAFGQGAGPVRVSHEAIEAATAKYEADVKTFADQWHSVAPQALEFACAFGRAAALDALADKRAEILPKDLDRAIERFSPKVIECPFCLETLRTV